LQTRRHQVWLGVVGLWGLLALGLLLVANPLPTVRELLDPGRISFAPASLPVVLLVYPAYSLLCIGLALSALRRPVASARFMGDLARRRARPWLVAASVVLLGVGLAVGGVAAWFLHGVQSQRLEVLSRETLLLLMTFDALISGLIAVAVVLAGRAIVSYEVFTGKTLPRKGLFRHWASSLILAGGYGALVGGSLTLPIDPIYHVLLATGLMTIFFALLSWRSYVEHDHSMERLRPFVTSQRLYERLIGPAAALEVDAAAPFLALCEEVLGTRFAQLVPLGPLAPLVGTPLVYPQGARASLPSPGELVARFDSPRTTCVPIDPVRHGGAAWAVPLWSERGLIGVLLLGEKYDGGLYTQEEIEIGRAVCERLIDTQASAEIARRLMALQRQRLAESQVLDRRARRTLHDEVLPRLHAAMLVLNGASAEPSASREEATTLLAEVHRQVAHLLRAMPPGVAPEVARHGLLGALRQVVEGEFRDAFDGVTWHVEPRAREAARSLSPIAAEVVYGAAREAVRNAARHGRGGAADRPLHLRIAVAWRDGIEIAIEDDGVGVSAHRSPPEGGGQGLALHSAMMAVVGGTLAVESVPGASTRVTLTLPHGELFEPSGPR
ncbi:MAG TPA: ATP-binding protein, partial [Chloroflexota bacterium]